MSYFLKDGAEQRLNMFSDKQNPADITAPTVK